MTDIDKKFLRQLSEELHKPALKKFPTRKVFVRGLNDTWAMDLADMGPWKKKIRATLTS